MKGPPGCNQRLFEVRILSPCGVAFRKGVHDFGCFLDKNLENFIVDQVIGIGLCGHFGGGLGLRCGLGRVRAFFLGSSVCRLGFGDCPFRDQLSIPDDVETAGRSVQNRVQRMAAALIETFQVIFYPGQDIGEGVKVALLWQAFKLLELMDETAANHEHVCDVGHTEDSESALDFIDPAGHTADGASVAATGHVVHNRILRPLQVDACFSDKLILGFQKFVIFSDSLDGAGVVVRLMQHVGNRCLDVKNGSCKIHHGRFVHLT